VVIGNPILTPYQAFRDSAKSNLFIVGICILIFVAVLIYFYKKLFKKLTIADKKIVLISIMFFIIPLLPFLPLGNIAPRYDYLASFGAILFLIFILKKIYMYLLGQYRYIALIFIFLISFIFIFIQVQQLQKENTNWQYGGAIANNFIEYMNFGYEDLKLGDIKNPIFYFVNTPIHYKTAWVFPVGVNDAIWFEYKERNPSLHTSKSPDEARDMAFGHKNARVFIFDKDGNIHMMKR